ncbi:YbfB/YjiJ family MFS transporter [Moraxella sp. ZJ142]|uniref:YbfB/YjiJ family MFS transporter n=1 Tax=Moraxella marmotae TaxID=3344520 RepID=UPI0035D47B55
MANLTIFKQADRWTLWRNLIAVMMALAAVHIFGRFIYTPLLPYFIADGLYTLEQGADLASMNYLGYLLGALLAVACASPRWIKPALLISLLINVASTAWQCLPVSFDVMMALRLVNGITNGVVFVLAPALMLEWLHEQGYAYLSGYMYLGVSAGLVASGFVAAWSSAYFVGSHRWLPALAFALVFGAVAFYQLYRLQVNFAVMPDQAKSPKPAQPLFDKRSSLLFLAYLGGGLGYILPMTFLPTLAHLIHKNHWLNPHIWTMVAVSCLLFTPVWNRLGSRIGDKMAIVASYVIQGVGVGALLLLPNVMGVVLCALGVGAGFLGSVMCTQRYARHLQPAQGIKLSAVLIAIYAGAQLLAPLLAKWWIAQGADLLATFAIGFWAFVWSVLCMLCIKDT